MWPFGKQSSQKPDEVSPSPEAEPFQERIIEEPSVSSVDIQDMRAHRHDVEYQCELVLQMMQKGEFLAYAFERAVTLLRKEHRYEEETIICRYVKDWSAQREAEDVAGNATRINPKVQRIVRRLDEAEALWLENPTAIVDYASDQRDGPK